MAMKNNKRGIFFTFIAILLMMVLMILFKPETELSFNKDIPVIKTRVTKINDFVNDFENSYLPNSIASSSSRTLTSLTYYMDVENKFLTNLQDNFKEVLLDGTIQGTPIDSITGETLMTGNTLKDWINKFKQSAKDILNVDLECAIGDLNIYQETPWFIDIKIEINYSISSETASWARNYTLIKTKLSIDRLYDPLYYKETDGAYKKKISKTDIKFDEWNAKNLSLFIEEEEYVHWQGSNAPNFLMRFTNDLTSSSCCGIESAVNPDELAVQKYRVYIDYLFFDSAVGDCSSPDVLYTITHPDIDSRFKLDWSNVAKYDVTEDASELHCP